MEVRQYMRHDKVQKEHLLSFSSIFLAFLPFSIAVILSPWEASYILYNQVMLANIGGPYIEHLTHPLH